MRTSQSKLSIVAQHDGASALSRVVAAFSCVAIATLVACKPTDSHLLSGDISLEYLRSSKSDVTFRLINGTGRTIYLRGSHLLSLAIEPWAGDTGLECEAVPYAGSEEEPIGFGEGTPAIFKISPGETIRLVVPTGLPQRFKGGRCRLKVRLQDGTIVGPSEFQP